MAFATFDCTFHGVEDVLRVIDLVDGSWSSGAVVAVVAFVSVVADVSFIRVRTVQAPPPGIPAMLVRGLHRAAQAPIHLT